MSPYFIKSIIEKEDKYFYLHPGVNPLAIGRAFFSNLVKNKRVSGASTITMQVVRMTYPQKRTYLNKFTEILRAFQLELHCSKAEILNLYLNKIPFGSNIEGIKSASYIYFNKPALKLNLAESMVLSIVPNKPSLLNLKGNNNNLTAFKTKWLDKFEEEGVFEKSEIQEAKKQNVSFTRHSFTKLAPHLSDRLQKDASNEAFIKTNIIRNLQLQTENQIRAYVKRVENIGLKNAMAIVINNKTMEVITYCGSSDYNNRLDGGQVDGIQSVRSPGSTLKPFLYAFAMEKGMINPKKILYDIPSDFNGFKPENFDKTYAGQVSMKEALQRSLNVPAVKTLEEYGVNNFILELKKANFKSITENENKLGMSMILGGCGVSMEEMAKYYATLANNGKYQELNYVKSKKYNDKITGNQLFSPASTYIISDILSGIERPDFPNNFEFTFRLPKIAWKTGTSFGKRDAWAFGYNPNYTVGVWLGNFSGESIPLISGASVATPLLFQIFNNLENSKSWFKLPDELMYRNVCAVSGLPKNDFCKTTQIDYFIKNVFHKSKCQHIKTAWVNPAETFSYCAYCLDKSNAVKKEYNNYPQEYQTYLQDNGQLYGHQPPHNPLCGQLQNGSNSLNIISPKNGGLYFLESKNPQQLELRAMDGPQTEYLLWYHNNILLGKFPASERIFIKPSIGTNDVSCTNDVGKTARIKFETKAME